MPLRPTDAEHLDLSMVPTSAKHSNSADHSLTANGQQTASDVVDAGNAAAASQSPLPDSAVPLELR